MHKLNIQKMNSENPVNELLSDVVRFSTRYQKLTPTEKQIFDARLEQWSNSKSTKTATQTANLGGHVENEPNPLSESILKLWKQPQPTPKPKPTHKKKHVVITCRPREPRLV